ncbi:MAG: hypothetical protein ABIY70_02985 [Capsulimonas sp.]|uniref:hypothetical protein n=1 Tax=Capsulimonas sp. TaxID=2494211 RepID=UPI003265C226
MQTNKWMTERRWLAVLTLTGCAVCAPVLADAEQSPVIVTASLAPATARAGIPIAVHFCIKNQLGTDLVVDLDDGGNPWEFEPGTWFTVAVVDSQGHARSIDCPILRTYQGAYSMSKRLVKGASLSNSFATTRQFTIDQAGQYDVIVHVRLPYSLRDDKWSDYLADFTFPVVVAGVSSNEPVKTAQMLSQRYFVETDSVKRELVLQSLMAMPLSSSAPAWRSLVSNSEFTDVKLVGDYLGARPSAASANVLANLCIEHPRELPSLQHLSAMYHRKDNRIRVEIERVYEEHGLTVPPDPPIRVD